METRGLRGGTRSDYRSDAGADAGSAVPNDGYGVHRDEVDHVVAAPNARPERSAGMSSAGPPITTLQTAALSDPEARRAGDRCPPALRTSTIRQPPRRRYRSSKRVGRSAPYNYALGAQRRTGNSLVSTAFGGP